jgi:mannose-6-phosphate isomerase-like protein (cupin superfamily)
MDITYPRVDRVWGHYLRLFEDGAVKLKELVVEPRKGISYQRHFRRSEIWFVSKGRCYVKHARDTDKPNEFSNILLETDDVIPIRAEEWHQIYNPFDAPCHIIEIQYGLETTEDDIERLEYYEHNELDL